MAIHRTLAAAALALALVASVPVMVGCRASTTIQNYDNEYHTRTSARVA